MTDALAVNEASGELLTGWDDRIAEDRLDDDHDAPLTAALVVVRRAGASVGIVRRAGASVGIVRRAGEEVLLVFDRWKQQWELPGGAREPGESPRATAARELAEETTIQIPADELIFAGVSSYLWTREQRRERLAIYRTRTYFDSVADFDPVAGFAPGDEIEQLRWWDRAAPLPSSCPLDAAVIDCVMSSAGDEPG